MAGMFNSGIVIVCLLAVAGCDSSIGPAETGNGPDTHRVEPVFSAGQLEDEAARVSVFYDEKADLISIRAQAYSLKRLLGKITLQTGIETRVDDEADRLVDVDLVDEPLNEALESLLGNVNHVMHYAAADSGQKLITEIEVLKQGSEQGFGAPVVPLFGQASIIANRYPMPDSLNIAQQRWQARLARMPQAKRLEVEAHYRQQQEKRQRVIAEHEQRIQAIREQNRKRRLEREQRDEALKARDPELYEARMQQREVYRQELYDRMLQRKSARAENGLD